MSGAKSVEQWKTFIESCLDFRPADAVFRIARDMFTEPELFDLEMGRIVGPYSWRASLGNKYPVRCSEVTRCATVIPRESRKTCGLST